MQFYRKAKGRANHVPGQMNKTEARYSVILDEKVKAGEIVFWRFEALKLRLADRTFYTPDFLVMDAETGELHFHEVKGGFITEDALIKFKVATETFKEFGWVMLQQKKATGPFEVIRGS